VPLFGVGINGEKESKTSKRVLNANAIKFKLHRLYSNTIRYEVIYKNLLRDARKFFSNDFNEVTDYIHKKRKNPDSFFFDCLRAYVETRFGKTYAKLGVSQDLLITHLGSLIYPKEMLRCCSNSFADRQSIFKIYHSLYKFSLERLQKFINNPSLIFLFLQYLRLTGKGRIQ